MLYLQAAGRSVYKDSSYLGTRYLDRTYNGKGIFLRIKGRSLIRDEQ